MKLARGGRELQCISWIARARLGDRSLVPMLREKVESYNSYPPDIDSFWSGFYKMYVLPYRAINEFPVDCAQKALSEYRDPELLKVLLASKYDGSLFPVVDLLRELDDLVMDDVEAEYKQKGTGSIRLLEIIANPKYENRVYALYTDQNIKQAERDQLAKLLVQEYGRRDVLKEYQKNEKMRWTVQFSSMTEDIPYLMHMYETQPFVKFTTGFPDDFDGIVGEDLGDISFHESIVKQLTEIGGAEVLSFCWKNASMSDRYLRRALRDCIVTLGDDNDYLKLQPMMEVCGGGSLIYVLNNRIKNGKHGKISIDEFSDWSYTPCPNKGKIK